MLQAHSFVDLLAIVSQSLFSDKNNKLVHCKRKNMNIIYTIIWLAVHLKYLRTWVKTYPRSQRSLRFMGYDKICNTFQNT